MSEMLYITELLPVRCIGYVSLPNNDSKPEDYFGLFYTEELMQQVSVSVVLCRHLSLEPGNDHLIATTG